MNVKKLRELQEKLDKIKYEESEIYQKDQCGTYVHCIYCNKKNKYPCGTAFIRFSQFLEDSGVEE